MFETIFSVLLRAASGGLSAVVNWFTANMELDLEQFYKLFPVFSSIYDALTPIAFSIILLLAAWNLGKYFTGGLAEVKERPITIIVRTILASGMVVFGGHLVAMLVKLASFPYEAFSEMSTDATAIYGPLSWGLDIGELAEKVVTESLGAIAGIHVAYLLVCLVVTIMVAFNLLKLIFEIIERYLMVGFLAYFSPLAFSTLASQSSSMIFSKWLGMLVGQCLLMTLSSACYNIVLSGLGTTGKDGADTLFKLILVMAACRIGCRMDTHLQQLGVGVGTTGGSLMDEMLALARTAMMFGRGIGANRGGKATGGDGTGHAPGTVLGGHEASDGSAVPDEVGYGALGAIRTGWRRGMAAYKAGEGTEGVQAAVTQGMKDGFGAPQDTSGMTPKQTAETVMKSPMFIGRTLSNKMAAPGIEHNAARSPVTTAQTGTATRSADGTKVNLSDQAKKNGVKVGKEGELQGNDSQAVADFAAANINNPAAQDMIAQTARMGSNEISEKALFGNHNDLVHDPSGEMGQGAFDQNMSDMTLSTFGDDMARMEANEEEASDEQRGVIEAYRAMRESMDGNTDDGKLANVKAGDIDGDPDKGRELTADLQTEAGTTFGRMSIVDQKGFDHMSDAEKQGYVPLKSATGQQYYAKATGVSTSTGETQAGQFSCPTRDLKGMGVQTTSMNGKEVMVPTDSPQMDATKMNSMLKSADPFARKVAADTMKDDAACPPENAQQALFNPQTGAIGAGNDQAMASMLRTAIPSEGLNQAATAMQTESGAVIPEQDARHFSDAVQAAADGKGPTADGYSVQNLTKDDAGVVRGEYVTPEGDSYGFAMRQTQESSPAVAPEPVYESGVSTWEGAPIDADDDLPSPDELIEAQSPQSGVQSQFEAPAQTERASEVRDQGPVVQTGQTRVQVVRGTEAFDRSLGQNERPSYQMTSERVERVRTTAETSRPQQQTVQQESAPAAHVTAEPTPQRISREQPTRISGSQQQAGIGHTEHISGEAQQVQGEGHEQRKAGKSREKKKK